MAEPPAHIGPVPALRRRRLLAAAAGGLAAGAALSGCGLSAPTLGFGAIRLVFATYSWAGDGQALLAQGAAAFEQQVHGVRLTTVAAQTDPWLAVSSLLDGTGPDVFWGQNLAPFAEANAVLPLDAYLGTTAAARAPWPGRKLAMLRTAAGLCGLPAYNGVMCYALRLQDWEDLHLAPPAPTWTHADLAAAAARLTRDGGGHHRYGTSLAWYTNWLGDASWVFPAFGGAQTAPDGTASTLSVPAAVAAGQWVYNLLWSGRACTRDQCWSGVDIANDTTAMRISGTWEVADQARAYGADLHWDYHPFPVFPKGRTTYTNTDFFGISARCPHPEAAWELLRWVSGGTDWQRWVMRTGLLAPSSNDLWEEWAAQVRAVAPAFRHKALHWFGDAARNDYAIPQARYKYADGRSQAVAAGYIAKLWNRQIPQVQSAFYATDQAINALLNEAAAAAGPAVTAAAAVRAALAGKAKAFALPLAGGVGVLPAPVAAGATAGDPPGVYALRGTGAGTAGTADGCTFASAAAAARRADFTCRVDAFANVDGPRLSPQAQVGLMARGARTGDAAMVAVAITGTGAIAVSVRPVAGVPPQVWQTPGPAPTGGHPREALVRPGGGRSANALTRPLWLRLHRDGAGWTALASADGRRFTPAGPTVTVQMAGCWVGPFAASGDTAPGFKPGEAITATFAQVTPHPTETAQIGRA